MPMLKFSWEPANAARSSSVTWITFSRTSIDLMRFCCCQTQLFQSFSSVSFQMVGRSLDLKRSRTVFFVTMLKAIVHLSPKLFVCLRACQRTLLMSMRATRQCVRFSHALTRVSRDVSDRRRMGALSAGFPLDRVHRTDLRESAFLSRSHSRPGRFPSEGA